MAFLNSKSGKSKNRFLSTLGQHTTQSLGKDLGLDNVIKSKSIDEVMQSSQKLLKNQTLLKSAGLKIAEGIVLTTINNAVNTLLNPKSNETVMAYRDQESAVMSKGKMFKTTVEIGIPCSQRLLRQLGNKNVDIDKKILRSSTRDYIDHSKRKDLKLQTGFKRKIYAFLLEDSYVSTDDLDFLYMTSQSYKNFKNKAQLLFKKGNYRNIIGCIKNMSNKIRITNFTKEYSSHIRIHLVRIKKRGWSCRGLLNNTFLTKEDILAKNYPDWKIASNKTFKAVDATNNKITGTVEVDRCVTLNESSFFKDHCEIVKSWYHELSEGSTWDFNINQKMGDGMDLTELIRIQREIEMCNIPLNESKDSSISYNIILEMVGDPRCKVIRLEDGDVFTGTSPSQIGLEFTTQLEYLVEYKSHEEESKTAYTMINRKHQVEFNEEDQMENLLSSYFAPDREDDFNLDIQDIRLFGESKSKKKYKLIYETPYMEEQESLVNEMKSLFEAHNINPKDVTINDYKFAKNINRDPSVDNSTTDNLEVE